ncbi:MAG: hypothetical protein IJG88_04840 [Eggerthellaceae bacterium]|nr:hypothetical protein [Eggerthellaceae bacterium]
MYHELTYAEIARRRRVRIAAALVCVLLCVVLAALVLVSSRVSEEQAELTLHDTITTAAMQCAAVEGSYPSSLAYLEERYGVVYNHDRFIVNYEWFADNVPPTVTVVRR